MKSMENFFNWMTTTLPNDDVLVWFNVHNMTYEKIELYGDVFKSLNHIIIDTYLGDESGETKINLTFEDKNSHFEWCWKKLIQDFLKENITIKSDGVHKDYFKNFFFESFYEKKEKLTDEDVISFIRDIFDIHKNFTKPDLEILTELYKMIDANVN